MSESCPKCGTESRDGGNCPVYHGMTGSGFCPIWADGETALETATRFHDWWLRGDMERNELEKRVLFRSWLWKLMDKVLP